MAVFQRLQDECLKRSISIMSEQKTRVYMRVNLIEKLERDEMAHKERVPVREPPNAGKEPPLDDQSRTLLMAVEKAGRVSQLSSLPSQVV